MSSPINEIENDSVMPGAKCDKLNKGSLSLEASILVPLCMIVILSFIRVVYAYNAELNLRAATDAAAREASLALSTAGLWEQFPQTVSNYLSEETEIKLPAAVDQWILELTATNIGREFVLSRVQYFYENEMHYTGLGNNLIRNLDLQIHLAEDASVLWIDVDYSFSVLGQQVQRSLRQPAVLWHSLPTIGETVEDIPNDIWSMDNFGRGMFFQSYYGRNLPTTYPVFSIFEYGQATSILSIDLTAPTYQSTTAIESKIASELESIASYNDPGTYWKNHPNGFLGSDIRSRTLLVIIPTNSPGIQFSALENMRFKAYELVVNLRIVRAGASHRYDDS